MKSSIEELLKRPIAYQPIVAKAFDSVTLAILWCQFYYWSERTNDPDGWVYKTRDDVFDETGLGRKQQETARKIGAKLGVMESIRMGEKGVMHYRVDIEKAKEVIEKYIKENPRKEIRKIKIAQLVQKNTEQILPEWINKLAWQAWMNYRKESKKRMTETTIKLQLAFLEKHKADHAEIIKKSIMMGWTGLFELKKDTKRTAYIDPRLEDKARAHDKNMERIREERTSEESEKVNENLRKIREQTKLLAGNFKIK